MNRIFLTYILLLFVSATHAQETVTLHGNVKDAFLERGLFNCHVVLMRADSTAVESEVKVFEVGSDSMHFSTIYNIAVPNRAGEYVVHVSKDGYTDGRAEVTIPEGNKQGSIEVPMIEMRRLIRTVNLGEVVVKATRIKVKTRGDTLVYDASAFSMPEGSMLSHLIEQLPGARINDEGEIFINGRKVDELTLNSKSLFRGNKTVLLDNLPYFTVKEIKVFERQSMMAALMRKEDEKPEYVMDVQLKDEYSLGLIADGEAAGGTHERYLARLFGILQTKTVTFGVYANMNNVNDRKQMRGGGWNVAQGWIVGSDNLPQTRRALGMSVDYQSKRKSSWGFPETQSYTEVAFDKYDVRDESQTYREYFLPVGTAYGRILRETRDKSHTLQCRETFSYFPLGIYNAVHFSYHENCRSDLTALKQWDDESVISAQLTERPGRTRTYDIYEHLRFPIPGIKKLDCGVTYSWNRTEQEGFSRQVSSLDEAVSDYRHEHQDACTTEYSFEPHMTYDRNLWGRLHLIMTERYKASGSRSTDNLFVLSELDGWGLQDSVEVNLVPSDKDVLWQVYDPVNSTYSSLCRQENEFTFALKLDKGGRMPFDATLSMPLYVQHERLDYRRGTLDTLARHNMFAFNPSLHLKHKKWFLEVGVTTTTPELMRQMPYRDARNPLNIIEGNPALKDNRRINAAMSWTHGFKGGNTGESSPRLASKFTYHVRSVAQGFTYDAQTGAYTFRPENVEGNWSWSTSYDFTLALGSRQRWWIDSGTSQDVWHSVDYTSVSGFEDAQLNKVETVNLGECVKIRYIGRDTKVTLIGNIRWRRTWGHRPSQTSVSAFDYRYGVTAGHTLQAWRTTLKTEACMYSRRGYSSEAMNKDELVVNASVTQPLMGGKVTLTLEGHDLLHQISNTAYEVNAQGRTESWHRVTPNYIMLHAVYHFNSNTKRQ